MHVASLLFLFPECDTDLNDHDALIVAARAADFFTCIFFAQGAHF